MIPLLVAAALAEALVAAPLDAARWRERRLVVFAPDAASSRLAGQRRAIDRAAFAERDLGVVEVVGDRVDGASDAASALRARFHVPPGVFRVVLVGKDGHVALTSPVPVATARVAATIDAMPMRRDEMRRPR